LGGQGVVAAVHRHFGVETEGVAFAVFGVEGYLVGGHRQRSRNLGDRPVEAAFFTFEGADAGSKVAGAGTLEGDRAAFGLGIVADVQTVGAGLDAPDAGAAGDAEAAPGTVDFGGDAGDAFAVTGLGFVFVAFAGALKAAVGAF